MKKLRNFAALALALACLLALAGCGGTPAGGSSAPAGSEASGGDGAYTVAYVAAATSLTTYTTILESGIKSACQQRGWEYLLFDAEGDSSRQAEQIESLKLMDVDLAVLFAADNEAAVTWVQELSELGIKVVLFASSINEEGWQYCEANVVSDSYQMGVDIANYFLGVYGADSGITLAVLNNVPGQYDFVLRLDGFNGTLADTNWNFVGGDYCFADPAAAQTYTENYMTAYDVDAIFGTTDANTVGACVAVEDAGKAGDITIVSIDGCKEAFDYVKSGTMTMTLFYDVSGMVDQLMSVCGDVHDGKTVQFEQWIPYYIVDAGNVDEYYDRAEW